MTARDPNIEQDVRAIVRRVVDGLLGQDVVEQSVSRQGGDAPDIPVGSHGDPVAQSIAIGADHGGFALKERLGFKLKEAGYSVTDCGTDSTASVDYPDIAAAVARQVQAGSVDLGIMIDGAGIGSAMAANKLDGVRAALCYDISTARNARQHNHANVLTLGAGLIGDALAWQITEEFIATPFGGDRHARRVDKITALEKAPLEH